jgi:UDP-2-acetamido-2-deoxy-ribo-hexuluronate aminotransferase
MKKIQMVDLISQYEKIQAQVDSSVLNVIRSAAFINGPEVKSFQAELEAYNGSKHVIPCANGTDALQIAMMALDLKPGDEVIVPTFTYVATAEVIALLRLTPVLVDVDPLTFNIDVARVEKAITPRTKAVVPVHLFGQCADMDPLMELCKKHNLYVIEDAAQGIGSDYISKDGTRRKAGSMGHIGCTSFFPSKNLGCYGDGGAIFTNDDTLAAKMRMVANHGQSRLYYFDEIGVNSRLDSIQAAILRCKLPHLDSYNASRRALADAYDAAFAFQSALVTPTRAPYTTHVFHQYTLQVVSGSRDALKDHLNAAGVPAMIYYPVPLHQQKAYLDPRYKDGDFPVSENLCATVISLPMQTELDAEQIAHITSSVLSFFK